jgi:GntR family transcriptional regulator, transcriptional repressor for pyruvate dehydrogenase complex
MTYARLMASRPTPLFTNTEVQRRPRLSDQVAQLMLEGIQEQQMAPGERLPSERELGEQFGVSRTVVREAVRALVAKGVIEVVSGSGLRIAEASATNVRESLSLYLANSTLDYEKMHDVRRVLEVHMAGIAAERSSPDDLQLLTDAHEAMARAVEEGKTPEELAVLDLQFHRAIARATHNELFLILLDSIGEGLLDVRRHNLRVNAEQTIGLHDAVRERIHARDPEGARNAMSVHLEDTVETWREMHRRRHAG